MTELFLKRFSLFFDLFKTAQHPGAERAENPDRANGPIKVGDRVTDGDQGDPALLVGPAIGRLFMVSAATPMTGEMVDEPA